MREYEEKQIWKEKNNCKKTHFSVSIKWIMLIVNKIDVWLQVTLYFIIMKSAKEATYRILSIHAQSGNMMCVCTHILYNIQCKHMISGIIEANPEEGKDSEGRERESETHFYMNENDKQSRLG